MKLIRFNKPFDVLSQFTDEQQRQTLKDFINVENVYPAGRLDRDSEGLLLLTDHGRLQHLIANPQFKLEKTYWVQVEHIPDSQAIQQLNKGVELKDGLTKPAKAKLIDEPNIWPRMPAIRERKHIATQWLLLTINEGKNRQVRRMTAAVGHPTLRLIRYAIGPWTLDGLVSGEYSTETASDVIKWHNDLETKNDRSSDRRKKPSISSRRRTHQRSDDTKPASRTSRPRRKPARRRDP